MCDVGTQTDGVARNEAVPPDKVEEWTAQVATDTGAKRLADVRMPRVEQWLESFAKERDNLQQCLDEAFCEAQDLPKQHDDT